MRHTMLYFSSNNRSPNPALSSSPESSSRLKTFINTGQRCYAHAQPIDQCERPPPQSTSASSKGELNPLIRLSTAVRSSGGLTSEPSPTTMDLNDESDSDSSESAGVALNMIAGGTGSGIERMHPALQAQLLRAQQRRAATTLHAIQHPTGLAPSSVLPMKHPAMTPTHLAQPRQLPVCNLDFGRLLSAIYCSVCIQRPSTAADETNVYDPFTAAGLDLQVLHFLAPPS